MDIGAWHGMLGEEGWWCVFEHLDWCEREFDLL